MKLNETQRNFRKQIQDLERVGYKFDNELYSPSKRKRLINPLIRTISIISILVLFWNFSVVIQWTEHEIKALKQHGIPTYMNEIKKFDIHSDSMLKDLIINNQQGVIPHDYIVKILKYENEFKENHSQLLQLKSPKKLRDYHNHKVNRYDNILYLLYELKVGAQLNSFNSERINSLITEINIIAELELKSLVAVFEELDIVYEFKDDMIQFETASYY